MGSNIGKDEGLCSVVTEAVKEVAKIPVWCKLTPATADIVVEAAACFRGGADAIVSSNTFPSLPIIDPETLEFEMNVDGLVSSGGLGGPAILPMSLANMAQHDEGVPGRSVLGDRRNLRLRRRPLSYFLLGCGTVQVCTAAMLDQAVGPNVIKRLNAGLDTFFEKHADKGWTSVEDFRGLRRDRVVLQSQIRRPDASTYQGGYEPVEGYAAPDPSMARRAMTTIRAAQTGSHPRLENAADGAQATSIHRSLARGSPRDAPAIHESSGVHDLSRAPDDRRGIHAVAVRRDRTPLPGHVRRYRHGLLWTLSSEDREADAGADRYAAARRRPSTCIRTWRSWRRSSRRRCRRGSTSRISSTAAARRTISPFKWRGSHGQQRCDRAAQRVSWRQSRARWG